MNGPGDFPLERSADRQTGDPGLYPFPGMPHPSRDGGHHPVAPQGCTERFGSARYRAYRFGSHILLRASGTIPNWNEIADFRQAPFLIHPPQFFFLVYRPEITSPALREFDFVEAFPFPRSAKVVVIRDAEGVHPISIEEPATEKVPSFMREVIGDETDRMLAVGLGASLQAAFDNAVDQLPAHNEDMTDAYVCYDLEESGRYRGGFAGLDWHYALVRAHFSDSQPEIMHDHEKQTELRTAG